MFAGSNHSATVRLMWFRKRRKRGLISVSVMPSRNGSTLVQLTNVDRAAGEGNVVGESKEAPEQVIKGLWLVKAQKQTLEPF